MDRGTWGGLVVLFILTLGLGYLVESASRENSPSATPPVAPTSGYTTAGIGSNSSQTTNTDSSGTDCATIANNVAQDNQTEQNQPTTVIQTYLNQKLHQCYYELNIFTGSGDETDIRVSPNNMLIASCTTSSSGLLCDEPGVGVITEPQFKLLLQNYFAD